jgi:hypothetical protein
MDDTFLPPDTDLFGEAMGLPATASKAPNDLPALGPPAKQSSSLWDESERAAALPAKHRSNLDLFEELPVQPSKRRSNLHFVPNRDRVVPDPERMFDAGIELPAPRSGVDFSQYLLTDAGNGLAFIDLFGEMLRFDGVYWRAWNGEDWVQVVELHLLPLARQATEEMLRWAARQLGKGIREAWEKHAAKTQSAPRLRAMIRLAAGESLARQRR